MRGNELLDKMELIDPAYVEAAEVLPKKKKKAWVKWGAMAACLCLVIGALGIIHHVNDDNHDPQLGEIILSDKTTAKVSYGYDESIAPIKWQLKYLTEDEMFAHENMYIFRGKVSGLSNVTIDFNGGKMAQCIATVLIEEVYQGDLAVGDSITMLIPCAITPAGSTAEDTGIIARLESGMEGIFMPLVYDENSYIEMNGAVLMERDIAACGLADGMRWAFLETEEGLLFLRSAYPGAKDADSLDEIEAYINDMLK